MTVVDKKAPILVTGATGYVAGWVVKRLLDKGLMVHAAVRDPENTDKLQYLNALAKDLPGDIRYFKTDLLDVGSYEEAMEGCQLVFHTASPFAVAVKDPQRDLVEPAVMGTTNVLRSATRTKSVIRVVMTSSCAAIYSDNADCQKAPGGVFTEQSWNSKSTIDHNPYHYSKTLSERRAWELANAQDKWRLIVLNPSFVIGPAIDPYSAGESMNVVKQFGDGTMRAGAPDFPTGIVDVRDLAEAHLRAGFSPGANGRYIISAHSSSFLQMCRILHSEFGDRYPIPRRPLPKWLLWLVAPIASKGAMTRKIVSRNVGIPVRTDNSKGIEELGLRYRPERDSLVDMFQQLIDHGRL